MKRRLFAVSGLAAALLLSLTTPAEAGPYRDCSAFYYDGLEVGHFGATGAGEETLASRTYLSSVTLAVKDTRADGHHVRIRLVTRRNDGTNHYWPWHAVYSGAGTSDTWNTTASDSGGIRLIWHEVAVFEGDTKLGSCGTEALQS